MWGALGLFAGGKKKKRNSLVGPNEVAISEDMAYYRDKNYNNMVALFKSGGFQNISAIPLNDLNFLTKSKNGRVDKIAINGNDDFDEGDVFQKNAQIIITYHSIT